MHNHPSTSMKVFITDTFGLLGELEFEETGREDVEGGWGSVLNDEGRLLGFGDYAAESGEWVRYCFWIINFVRYGVLIVNYICFFFVENINEIGIGCLNAIFISLWVIMGD